jgi:hypothetical protein
MAGLTAGSLFASLVVSGVGLVLTSYGKKLARPPQLIAGLVMMIYPYFVPRVAPMLIVAGGLLAAMWLAIRRGY